jgi:MFS transporter, SHS family, lactate transporter
VKIIDNFRRLTPLQRHTFTACFLGWTLDAFDFFIVVFCVSAIANEFHATVAAVLQAVFLTLAMRPVGALVFGWMADKYGRRPTLMVNIIAFSVLELASAFAPSLKAFLILRACFGFAMGGEWGVGAALTFETLPVEGRGFFSGLLQEGYAVGYLLAAAVFGALFTHIGWRGMFIVGALPALLVIHIRSKVKESPAWVAGRGARREEVREVASGIWKHLGAFFFVVVLMFGMNSFSHGTQDIYPTFLTKNHGFSPETVGKIAIICSIGALLGGMVFGAWSEKIGRRRTIAIAAVCAIPMIPLWAYGNTAATLAIGGFLMQFMVQGAWGVIPAHLNELSPPSTRATFPGLAYQLGNLFASKNAVLQAVAVEKYYDGRYAPVLAWTVLGVAVLIALVTLAGREASGADLTQTR